MNTRVILHIVSAILTAIVGGGVVFEGIPPAIFKDIIAVLTLVNIGIQTYMGGTTTGESKAQHDAGLDAGAFDA